MTDTRRACTALLVATCLVAAAASASAGKGPASDDVPDGGPVKEKPTFGGMVDDLKPIEHGKGPFYGLRVNSMDLAGDARRVAAFDYECEGFLPGEDKQTYQVVRTAWKGPITPNASCDEVLAAALPKDAAVKYAGRLVTTRWIRDVGPTGTPVGGFVGRLEVLVGRTDVDADSEDAKLVPLLQFHVIGTQGLRPHRGDPDDAEASAEARCGAPLHDEGFYRGGFDKRSLKALAARFSDSNVGNRLVKTLAEAQIVGTFEGRLHLGASESEKAYDFAALDKAGWWFDGVMGWKCRPPKDKPSTTPK
jgi:hypothetical protein